VGPGDGQQAGLGCDWAYSCLIGALGSAGEVAGEQRRRRRGNTAAQGQHGRSDTKSGEGEGSTGQHVVVEASGRPSGVAKRVSWLRVQAGDRAHQRLLSGGSGKLFSGEQAVWLGQHAGVQA
jgi:hypothetical protein